MKYELIEKKYGAALREQAEEAAKEMAKKISFAHQIVADVEEDGERTVTIKCPRCGKETTFNLGGRSYYSITWKCASCGYTTRNTTSGEKSYNYNEEVVSTVIDGDDLAICRFKSSFCYDYETSNIKIEIRPSVLCLFQKERYDGFIIRGDDVSRSKYSIHHLIAYGKTPSTIDPDFGAWCAKKHVTDARGIVRYYERISAATKVVKTNELDMSAMPKIDKDDILRRLEKRSIFVTSKRSDRMTGKTTRQCVCGKCGTQFVAETDGSYWHQLRCPNCGLESNEINTESEISNPVFYIDAYVGSSCAEGIIVRHLNTPIHADTDPSGKLYMFFDSNNEKKNETVMLFDFKGNTHKFFSSRDEENYTLVDGRRSFGYYYDSEYINIADPKTRAKWCAVERIKNLNDDKIIKYLELYARFPVTEKLLKGGFVDLIENIVSGPRSNDLMGWAKTSFKGKETIESVFDLPRKYVLDLKSVLSRLDNIGVAQKLYAADNGVTPEDARYVIENNVSYLSLLNVMNLVNINVHTAVQYIEAVRVHQCCPPNMTVDLWEDYLKVNQRIGADLNDKSLRYPNSLKREHDKAMAKQRFVADDELKEDFSKKTQAAQELFGAHSKAFEIKAPASMQELFEEGRALSHSVGSYTDVIAKGATCILFLRKKAEANKPYLTVEVIDDKVTQIRGYSNRLVNEEAEADAVEFVVAWAHRCKLNTDEVLKTAKSVRAKMLASEKIYRILENE